MSRPSRRTARQVERASSGAGRGPSVAHQCVIPRRGEPRGEVDLAALLTASREAEQAHARAVVSMASELLALSTSLLQAQLGRHRFSPDEIAGFQAVLDAAAVGFQRAAIALGVNTRPRPIGEVH